MDIPKICQKYFHGFHDLFESKSTAGQRVAGVIKILSYFTVVIPFGFATVYALSALYGRITHPAAQTSTTKKVEAVKGKQIIPQPTQIGREGQLPTAQHSRLSETVRNSIRGGDIEAFRRTIKEEKLTLQKAFETVCELEREDPEYIRKLVTNHRHELNLEEGMWSALLYGNTVAVECLLGHVEMNKSGSVVGNFLHRYAAGGLSFAGIGDLEVDESIETYKKMLELLARKVGINAINKNGETPFDIFCGRGWATADFAARYQAWIDVKADTKKRTAREHLQYRLEAYQGGDRGTISTDAAYQAILKLYNNLNS